MKLFTKTFFLSIVLLSNIFPQWSSDPSQNLMICDLTGEQALSKIVSTSDGGCYISWFDTRSGNYQVYLQRLDVLGNKLWATDGLLISDNPQNTFIVDYDLNVDDDDNALLAFTDIRNGGNLNPYAYKISPNGNFLWGSDGIELNPTADFQANPKILETSDGNVVVAWIVSSSPSKIGLQKISPDGNKLWGTLPVFISSATEGFNYPSIVKSDNGSAIVIHTVTTGNFPAQVVKIRATKIESGGTIGWGGNGIMLQNLGRIAAFTVPKVISDGNDGGIVAWHDDRDNNNLQSAFIQRISSTGSLSFPVDGAEGSLESNSHKFNPVPVFNSSTQEAYIFWLHTEPNQNQNGLNGQRFSQNGDRQWGNNGIIFKALSAPFTTSISSINAQMGNGRVYTFYLEGNAGGVNTKVEGFACDATGNFLWPGNIITISNPTTEKLQMVSTVDLYFNCKLSWGDKRLDAQGIYAQDCNPDGQLGNSVTPVELFEWSVTYFGSGKLKIHWETQTETNNKGFEIERSFDKNNWITLGFVEGNGTTTYLSSYDFSDELPINISSQKIYYRIKQIDYDGTFTYSPEIEIDIYFPGEFKLEQNYPNPFNPVTRIKYSVESKTGDAVIPVNLKVYDILGNEIATLVNELQFAGNYEIEFDATHLASGIYYYKIQAGEFSKVKKMILSK
ncbi:MAG TPA: T9SS type A sorting domain-containing protein [Ignavibacteriaceae bacterium]|nr:T9SS type A sorting domain-containing protein [Ignavibacteriaceae bacterium]